MIEVELLARGTRAATIRVSNGEAEMAGRVELFDTRVPVIDRRSGHQVRFADDPETWARNLDTIFRNPHLVAHTIEDTNPNPPPQRAGHARVSLGLEQNAWGPLLAGGDSWAQRRAERLAAQVATERPPLSIPSRSLADEPERTRQRSRGELGEVLDEQVPRYVDALRRLGE